MGKIVLIMTDNNKMFGGKLEDGVVWDCVEFALMAHPQTGNIVCNGVILGTMLRTPTNSITIELSSNSPFYQAYYKTTANIQMPD